MAIMQNVQNPNMLIYEAGRSVPDSAVKKIGAGAYGKAGLSDINPQWRIEKMTELFGACGDGWIWEPVECWMDNGICYAHITVQYATENGEYSKPIHGYGGTIAGRMDDSDLYKSTITDAVSNALRYLGIGADVWYNPNNKAEKNQFDTKYSAPPQMKMATPEQLKQLSELFPPERITAMLAAYKIPDTAALTFSQAQMVIAKRLKEIERQENAEINEILRAKNEFERG